MSPSTQLLRTRHSIRPGSLLLALGLLLVVGPVVALHSRVYPLAQIVKTSEWIGAGPGEVKGGELLLRPEALKGSVAALTMKLSGAAAKSLAPRVAKGQPFVLFGGKNGVVYGFTNGTWFQAKRAGDTWGVVATRPDMARTYRGKSDALTGLVRDVLAGRVRAPEPNPKAKPSLGPIVAKSLR